jgi:uncharacterized membrane-anchored protein
MKMKFYVDTDKGFYRDFILGTFAATKEDAHVFETEEEAQKMAKALQEVDKVTGCEVVAEDEEMEKLIDLAKKFVHEAEEDAAANPSSDEIQVVVVEPKKKPYKKIIKNDLENMKEIVGGWIENIFIGETETGARLGIVVNEEGKLQGLPYNRKIIGRGGSDILMGNMFITAYNLQGDNVSLSEAMVEKVIKRFSTMDIYLL